MALVGLLEADFPGSSHFEPFLCAGIGLNLRHDLLFKHDTLLADPLGRITYGALWAIKWSAKVGKSVELSKKIQRYVYVWSRPCQNKKYHFWVR